MLRTLDEPVDRIIALLQGLRTSSPSALPDHVDKARAIEHDLRATADVWLSAAKDADQVAFGVQFAVAGIEVGPAVKALATAAAWTSRTADRPTAERAASINLGLARSRLLSALRPLATLSPSERSLEPPAGVPVADAGPPAGATAALATPTAPADRRVLANIASYHRAHERYYTQNITEAAVDLYREANKLRIVAEAWRGGDSAPPGPEVDYSSPLYQAAGCPDLNALAAIPAIGVLFMEGEGEPAEIRIMKAKLQALAGAWSATGQWLGEKMIAAWDREQAVFAPGLIGLAQARFNTIATNWRGAREMQLAGRLLGIAIAHLQGINFRPAALRADRAASGTRLLHAGWVIALAAQTKGRSAADLADNDRNWTAYLDGLRAGSEPKGEGA